MGLAGGVISLYIDRCSDVNDFISFKFNVGLLHFLTESVYFSSLFVDNLLTFSDNSFISCFIISTSKEFSINSDDALIFIDSSNLRPLIINEDFQG